MQIRRLHHRWRAKNSVQSNTWWAVLFLAMALACACTKRIDFGPGGEIRAADELLRLTDQAERQIASIKGEARLRVNSPKKKGSLNTFVAAAEPDKLHLESLNFFGKPQAILVTAGARFELLDSDEGKYYRGPASQENLSRFMPVAVPVGELVAMMLGRAPRIRSPSASLELDSASRSYIVTLAGDGLRQVLWIDPSSHRVTRSQVRGWRAYDLAFDDFQSFSSTHYPRKATLSVPSEALQLELKYRDLAINEPLGSSLFELLPPPGVQIIELDETGNPRAVLSPETSQPVRRFGSPIGGGEEKR